MIGFDGVILCQVLTKIDDFQLVATSQNTWFDITTFKGKFGRQSDPIQIAGQRPRAIGLDGDTFTCLLLQFSHKWLVNEQRRLTTCQHNQSGMRILINLIHNLLQRHHRALLMLRIAKGTAQVAAAETHEDGGRSRVVAFALKGVEYFVDFIHDFGTSRLRDFGATTRSLAVP